MTVWRMRIACWIPNVTNTYSDFVIRVIFHCNNGYANASQCYGHIHCVPLYVVFSHSDRWSPTSLDTAVDEYAEKWNGDWQGGNLGGKGGCDRLPLLPRLSLRFPKSEPRTEPMHCCHPIPNLPNIFIWSLESNCC
jgi:hypothetical protein